MRILRCARGSRGFSLIETLVAISVFAVITVGITPLLVSSIRGAALSRSFTVGKSLAQESLERVRGLPYFDILPGRDVLDLYFPNLAAPAYDSVSNTFTTTCTATSSTPAGTLGCPTRHIDGTARIPAGYTLTYTAQFVTPAGGNPETFTPFVPVATYNAAAGATATPPSALLRITVTVVWTEIRPRRFSLATLVGDRKLSPERVRGSASVDYAVRAETAFQDQVLNRVSGLAATSGRTRSAIEIRAFANATVDTGAGDMRLFRDQYIDSNGQLVDGVTLDTATGASAVLRAPPSATPTVVTAPEDTVVHPDLVTNVGFLGATSVNEAATPSPVVQVVSGLPKAVTNFSYTGSPGDVFWVHNQPDLSNAGKLFHSSKRMMTIANRGGTGPNRMTGRTSAEATPVTPLSGRYVETKARVEFSEMVLLPVSFANQEQGVVVIEDFVADITCRSTGNVSTSSAIGSWSAKFKYWRDSNPTNGVAAGGYTTVQVGSTGVISGSTTAGVADPLAALKTENPLVLDAVRPEDRVYLFEVGGVRGYFEDWDAQELMTSTLTATQARIEMPYALRFVTARTNAANPQSKISTNVAKMSCTAVDNRG